MTRIPSDSATPEMKKPDALVRIILGIGVLFWVAWQCFGIEAMRPAWEDEVLYTLPAANWAYHGTFAIPQMGHFAAADKGWMWHGPAFPLLMAGWFKLIPFDQLNLTLVRLPTILVSALFLSLLAWACHRISGIRHRFALLAWFGIIFFDKTFVSNSVIGRMEFHALAACALACVCVEKKRPIFAGLFFGIGVAFHPFVVFFAPAFFLWHWFVHGRAIRPLLLLILGGGFIALPLMIWFLNNRELVEQQFLPSIHGSTGGTVREHCGELARGLALNYRFQVGVIGSMALLLAMAVWRVRSAANFQVARIGLACASMGLGGFLIFLLRGPASHLNYYTPISAILYLFMALFLALILPGSSKFVGGAAIGLCGIVLMNNALFGAAKTMVCLKNRAAIRSNAAVVRELLAQMPKDAMTVVPPNLWLSNFCAGRNFRISFLTLNGQTPEVYKTFLQEAFDQKPRFFIRDKADWPARNASDEMLAAHGYQLDHSWNSLYVNRYAYDGYRLDIWKAK